MSKITMADSIRPSFGIPFPHDLIRMVSGELECKLSREELLAMPEDKLQSLLTLVKEQPKMARETPMEWGWTLPSWEKCNALWKEAKCQVIFGGNRCLHGDTRIYTDGQFTRIKDIESNIRKAGLPFNTHQVISWHETPLQGGFDVSATLPFSKGVKECVKVTHGYTPYEFICSEEHMLLTPDGRYMEAKDLQRGTKLRGMFAGDCYSIVKSVTPAGKHECWDMTVPGTENYWAEGCFHHNSSKTHYASALTMDIMEKIPEAMTYSLQTNEERSIQINQSYLYNRLAGKYRRMAKKKGELFSLNWTQKNGFAGDVCILPPVHEDAEKGSACYFKNYSQYHNDAQAFEGLKGHLIHADEEIPFKLFETLFGRLGDFHGRLLLTVTTLQGYTPLVNDLLKGAETLETRFADLVGKDLPILQKAASWPDTYIHYWWTQDNPFIDSQEIVRSYANRPMGDKLSRLYGIPSKDFSNQFPKFGREANVIEHEKIPFIKNPATPASFYLGVDPGDGKPWVMVWVGFTKDGNVYVYRESPDIRRGEWAFPHKTPQGLPVGKKGPGQRPMGYGFQQWKNLIEEMEGDERILMRWMDPNYCKQPISKKEGQSNLLQEMAAEGMHFTPAVYDPVGTGVARINELLDWDDTEPLSPTNRPKLYISDRCENLLQSMTEYTGVSKAEQWKDFVDALRYVVVSSPGFVDDGGVEVVGGGGY